MWWNDVCVLEDVRRHPRRPVARLVMCISTAGSSSPTVVTARAALEEKTQRAPRSGTREGLSPTFQIVKRFATKKCSTNHQKAAHTIFTDLTV